MIPTNIIKLAEQCGIYQVERFDTASGGNQIESFYRAAYALGVADEREACAQVCDGVQKQYGRYTFTARVSAEAIRNRSNQ